MPHAEREQRPVSASRPRSGKRGRHPGHSQFPDVDVNTAFPHIGRPCPETRTRRAGGPWGLGPGNWTESRGTAPRAPVSKTLRYVLGGVQGARCLWGGQQSSGGGAFGRVFAERQGAHSQQPEQECEGHASGEQEWEGHASGEQQGQGGEQESQMAKPGLTKGWKPHGQPWGVRPERALDTELRDWTSVQWSTVVRAVSDHDREVMGDAGSSSLERPLRSVLHHVTGRRPHQCLWAASNPKPHRTVQLTGRRVLLGASPSLV